MVVSCIMGPSSCNCAHYFSVVESFEAIISLYAQQLTLNESQNFTAPSLTLVAELVSSCIFIYTHAELLTRVLRIAILFVRILQRSVEILVQDGRSFAIGNCCYDLTLTMCDTNNVYMYR